MLHFILKTLLELYNLIGVKLVDWLRNLSALVSISIILYLIFQTPKFSKELKKAINPDRSLSKKFVYKWERKIKRVVLLTIIASIFGIIAVIMSY